METMLRMLFQHIKMCSSVHRGLFFPPVTYTTVLLLLLSLREFKQRASKHSCGSSTTLAAGADDVPLSFDLLTHFWLNLNLRHRMFSNLQGQGEVK